MAPKEPDCNVLAVYRRGDPAGCPYGIHAIFVKKQDPMDMVGHDYKGTQFHRRPDCRNTFPFLADNLPIPVQTHFAINNFTK